MGIDVPSRHPPILTEMRILINLAVLTIATSAFAKPIPMVCSGEMYSAGTNTFSELSATLDLDARTFRAPIFGVFEITRIDSTTIVFGRETEPVSTLGNLDRLSGNMTILTTDHGQPTKLIASAKCFVAQRMF